MQIPRGDAATLRTDGATNAGNNSMQMSLSTKRRRHDDNKDDDIALPSNPKSFQPDPQPVRSDGQHDLPEDPDALNEAWIDIDPVSMHGQGRVVDNCRPCLPQADHLMNIRKRAATSFARFCKVCGLPFEQHKLYHDWLISHHSFIGSDLGFKSRKQKLIPGMLIPAPSGRSWEQYVTTHSDVRLGGSRPSSCDHVVRPTQNTGTARS